MSTEKNNQIERRQYYRFQELLMMTYAIQSEQQETEEQLANQQAVKLLNDFSLMTQHIKTSLSRVSNRSPEITNCFKILDNKINLLAQTLLYQDKQNTLSQLDVSISAGGISFAVDREIPADTVLKLELVLPPESNVLTISARVINCVKMQDAEHPYIVSTQFIDTTDVTQDIIVRHIMRCQSDQLRAENEI